jgi:hypothetical protein
LQILLHIAFSTLHLEIFLSGCPSNFASHNWDPVLKIDSSCQIGTNFTTRSLSSNRLSWKFWLFLMEKSSIFSCSSGAYSEPHWGLIIMMVSAKVNRLWPIQQDHQNNKQNKCLLQFFKCQEITGHLNFQKRSDFGCSNCTFSWMFCMFLCVVHGFWNNIIFGTSSLENFREMFGF